MDKIINDTPSFSLSIRILFKATISPDILSLPINTWLVKCGKRKTRGTNKAKGKNISNEIFIDRITERKNTINISHKLFDKKIVFEFKDHISAYVYGQAGILLKR